MAKQTIKVPDIGGAENVDVIEVLVGPGDTVAAEDSLIVLESDKASMDIPSPLAGKIIKMLIKEGDTASEGDAIAEIEVEGEGDTKEDAPEPEPAESKKEAGKESKAESKEETAPEPAAQKQASGGEIPVAIPDIGGSEGVDVIEVCVSVGDEVSEGDSLVVLESDKASMEVPSPASGKVKSISMKEGDKVSQGDPILVLESADAAPAPAEEKKSAPAPEPAPQPASQPASQPVNQEDEPRAKRPRSSNERHPSEVQRPGSEVYAGPAVRKLARQLGVELGKVQSSGPRGRITKDDVKSFVKSVMQNGGAGGATAGAGIPPIPAVDFAKFGEIDIKPMNKIQKLTAANMLRNWLNVPHVTQFDDVDISDLEDFRASMKAEAEKAGVKLTPLPFLIKACATALKAEPKFNVSVHSDGESLVHKKFIHIGIAVDTPNGLVVPVIRDADQKGLFELAKETVELAGKARDGKLMPKDMQGGCFTISSLGPIGGTGFTPMINAPEVAILGVSKASVQPVWNGKEFVPRTLLPLSLSYDHRAINGADAGRFFTYLGSVLADIRKLLV